MNQIHEMEPRSVSQKRYYEKKFREKLNRIRNLERKYTILYSLIIAFQSSLIIFWLYQHLNLFLLIPIIGLVLSVWGLVTFKERCRFLYKEAKEVKKKEHEIIEEMKQQEILEKKLAELENPNHV